METSQTFKKSGQELWALRK